MKIFYDQIEEEQLEIETALTFNEGNERIMINNFTGALCKGGKLYFLRGEMEVELHCVCDRCAEPAVIKLNQTVEVGVEPACKAVTHNAEYEITDEDGDIYTTAPDYMDLDDILRQEALLQLPLKRLCNKECKGIILEQYGIRPDNSLKGLSSLKQKLEEI